MDKKLADSIEGLGTANFGEAAAKAQDAKAVATAIDKLRSNNNLIPLVLKKFETDQAIRMNMQDAADRLQPGPTTINCPSKSEVTALKKRAKQSQITNAIVKSAKHLVGDEKTAVMLLPTSRPASLKTSSITIRMEEISTHKYNINSAWLGSEPFLLLSGKEIGGKRNPVATKLLDEIIAEEQITCYGPIIFVHIDLIEGDPGVKEDGTPKPNFTPNNITVKVFDDLVTAVLGIKISGDNKQT